MKINDLISRKCIKFFPMNLYILVGMKLIIGPNHVGKIIKTLVIL